MLKRKLLISIIVIIYLIMCNIIYNHYNNSFKVKLNNDIKISKVIDNDYIGYISIPKIKLKKNIFSPNSNKNNIEYNVEILDGSVFPNDKNEDSIIFLAAHSGDGDNAYFNDLKELKINDQILLSYNNIIYKYKIIEKKEIIKNGYITGNRQYKNEIILTTCSNLKNKQLLIKGILKSN